jgi:hypothetical protein
VKDSSYLRGHRYFQNLKPAELDELSALFSVLDCRAGACLIPAGGPVEGLFLIESGLVKETVPPGETSPVRENLYASGKILGLEALLSPYVSSSRADILEQSRILFLGRSDFLLWAGRRPRAYRRLASSLPGRLFLKKGPVLSASVLRENRLFWILKTIPTILFPPLLLMRLILRKRNGTFVEGDRLTCRYFRWKTLKNINLTIPLEQIQSVEVSQNGLMSRIMKTGNLMIRVNGAEGHVLVRNIPRPGAEQEKILRLKRRADETAQAAKHRRIRRDISRWLQKEEGIHLTEESAGSRSAVPQRVVFRKSLWVLIARIWWLFPLAGGAVYLILRSLTGEGRSLLWTFLGMTALLFLYEMVDWANDLYKVEGGFLLDLNKKPLGKERSSRQAELSVIQNVIAEQKGIWANLWDYGNLRIIIPGSGEGILWEGIRHPERAQSLILRERRAWMDSLSEKERQEQQKDLMLYCRILSQELSENNRS